MYPTLPFGFWDTLDSMDSGFAFEKLISIDPFDFDDEVVKLRDLEVVAVGKTSIGVHEVSHPYFGFVTPDSGIELDDSDVWVDAQRKYSFKVIML